MMYLSDVYESLLSLARARIRSGVITERALALRSGISQPHLNNALRNRRHLSLDHCGRLMRALETTVPEILWMRPGEIERSMVAVPVLRSRIGPGAAAQAADIRGYAPFPSTLADPLTQPLAARLTADLAMPRVLRPGDLVLLDREPSRLLNFGPSAIRVIAEGGGLRVRYVRIVRRRLQIGAEPDLAGDPPVWDRAEPAGRNILEKVRARIVWIGRQMEDEKHD